MCIYVKQTRMYVADKDIVCWKALEVVQGKNGPLIVTPFAFKEVPESVLNGEQLFVPDNFNYSDFREELEYKDPGERISVEDGFIHTYANMSSDLLLGEMGYHTRFIGDEEEFIFGSTAEALNCEKCPQVLGIIVYRCVIPKGTEYLCGDYVAHGSVFYAKSYASRAIRFEKKVAEFNNRYEFDNFMDFRSTILKLYEQEFKEYENIE